MANEKEAKQVPQPIQITEKAIEDMTLDEIDALSAEEIAIHLQRAELREKAMRLQKLSRDLKKERAQMDELERKQRDRINEEKQLAAQKKIRQDNCTHMKGGEGAGAVLYGRGDDGKDYALIRHVMPAGNIMILCLRCGREEYGPNRLTGQQATPGFAEFAKLPTKNHTSGSTLFFPIGLAPVIAPRI